MNKKKKILFVGSFADSGKDGSVGGQMYASKSLIKSTLSEEVNWYLIDSTAPSNNKVNIIIRIWLAVKRLILFLNYLFFKKIDACLIFAGDGLSFYEKGTMALISTTLNKKVILAPRSGLIKSDIEKKGLLFRYIKYIFKKVDFVICQGERWKKYFESYLDTNPEKFVVIPNWINYKDYPKETLITDKIIITFLAWVDRQKGIYEAFESISQLSNDYNIEFRIAGNGSDFENIRMLIKEKTLNEKIKLLGWITGTDKLLLLSQTDIFILPSYAEGMPNALLEAMASGKACIATNVGGIPDIIEHLTNGLLIEPKDAHSLMKAMETLILDQELRVRLGRNARQFIEQHHSLESAISKIRAMLYA